MKQLRVIKKKEFLDPSGNWNTAKNFFPVLEVNQDTGTVKVTYFESTGFQDKASIETLNIKVDTKGDSSFIRGEVDCQNWKNRKCSGQQKFCFAVFVGDSGHIYIHRAPTTKGWMKAKPQEIRKRLRKLGIGIENPPVQQGDFLLKFSNGNALPDTDFKHETMGAGHHKFEIPVLSAYTKKGRQYWIKEPTRLIHEAVDGIQHPTILVEPGKYIVGTTANSLQHENLRD